MVGINLAGLRYMQGKVEEAEDVSVFSDAFERAREKKRKKARKGDALADTAVPVLRMT